MANGARKPPVRRTSNAEYGELLMHMAEVEKSIVRVEGKVEGFSMAMTQHLTQAHEVHQDQETRLRALETEQNRGSFTRDLMGRLIGYVVTAVIAGGLALLIGRSVG